MRIIRFLLFFYDEKASLCCIIFHLQHFSLPHMDVQNFLCFEAAFFEITAPKQAIFPDIDFAFYHIICPRFGFKIEQCSAEKTPEWLQITEALRADPCFYTFLLENAVTASATVCWPFIEDPVRFRGKSIFKILPIAPV